MNGKENTEVVNFILKTAYEESFEPELAEMCREVINKKINKTSQSINKRLITVISELTEALITKDLAEKGFEGYEKPDDEWLENIQKEYKKLVEQKRYFSNFEMEVYAPLNPYPGSEEDIKEIESIYDQF